MKEPAFEVSEPPFTEKADNAMKGALTAMEELKAQTGGALSTLNKWKTEGTPLKGMIKGARLGLNEVLVSTRGSFNAVEDSIQSTVGTARAHTAAALDNLGVEYDGMVEFRHKHPELLVGSATLVAALPSALAGRRALLRNSLVAFTASAGIVYGLNWWDGRSKHK
ncbi:unnamed protein product [Choristocarpus tenellus]